MNDTQAVFDLFKENFSGANTIWVLVGAFLVFWMQAGFAMVEAGFTRAKNAGNIVMKNLMDFCIGSPLYWLFGFGIMFGTSTAGVIGHYAGIANSFNYSDISQTMAESGVPFWAYFIFQTMFCATTATIVSGAMAERTKFSAYCVYSAVISGIIYPIEAHWIWGGGWLSKLGFHDFAGSTCVHMVGGIAAFVGAAILGPRIGKYVGKEKKPRAIPGHSITLGALGVFILYMGWFGFNPCSTISIDDPNSAILASKVFVTTNIAAAVATCATMIFTWIKYGKPDVSMTLNGTLAGLVAVTAPCDAVSPVGAAIIGIVAGILVVVGVEFIDKVLKVDDPVGACGVHMLNGAWGTIAVGLFADGTNTEKGLFYGGGFHLLGVQLLGFVTVAAYTAVLMTIVFQVIKHTMGLRATPEQEREGMDISEHGLASAYADFAPATAIPSINTVDYSKKDAEGTASVAAAIPVTNRKDKDANYTYSNVAIICKQNKFEDLKSALAGIGVTGFTVTNILGCGTQKGATEYYRGTPVEPTLLPKVKVECVVSKVPVNDVVETARKVLYTGHIGDGKIFVSDVKEIVRVRTGETGFDALQETETN